MPSRRTRWVFDPKIYENVALDSRQRRRAASGGVPPIGFSGGETTKRIRDAHAFAQMIA